jgi:hypothetical protein
MLRRVLKREPVDGVSRRRTIARRVIEAERYPL